jgi:lipoate-protein ligase A
MNLPRAIEIEVGAHESAATTFARDQLLLLRCADDAVARARIWRRRESGLLLGRFHRADPASCAWADAKEGGGDTVQCGLSRRLSGGRIVPVGPGVVCITMAVPVVDWLDFSLREPRPEQVIKRALRPEQVLNRALRPLLALLRGDGVDAFYAGRDLVTVGGRAVAHASFTVMRDGVAMVEMQVAE